MKGLRLLTEDELVEFGDFIKVLTVNDDFIMRPVDNNSVGRSAQRPHSFYRPFDDMTPDMNYGKGVGCIPANSIWCESEQAWRVPDEDKPVTATEARAAWDSLASIDKAFSETRSKAIHELHKGLSAIIKGIQKELESK